MMRVGREARRKLIAIADTKDWPYTTTVEKAADALAAKEGIRLPEPAVTKSRRGKRSAA